MVVDDLCNRCKKERRIHFRKDNQQLCNSCYRQIAWKRKLIKCPRCERMKVHHGKGLCNGCYNSVFNIDNVKLHNAKKYHNIDYETYKNATKVCVICGFDKIVDLHHLDMNHDNNSVENLAGLCPNHHKMIHHRAHQKEALQALKDKGFNVPEGFKDDNLFKN